MINTLGLLGALLLGLAVPAAGSAAQR